MKIMKKLIIVLFIIICSSAIIYFIYRSYIAKQFSVIKYKELGKENFIRPNKDYIFIFN